MLVLYSAVQLVKGIFQKALMELHFRDWSERPRIIVLMLAIMLPAAALVIFGFIHLREIQQDKAIEAAIQREYQQVLAIAEKHIDGRAYDMAEEASAKFPDVDSSGDIDKFLKDHPELDYAFLWTGKGHMNFESQPARMDDRQFCSESQAASSDLMNWMDAEGPIYIARLKKIAAHTGRHVYITDHWITRGDKMLYQSLVMFIPRDVSGDDPALAGFIYNTGYLKNTFFPQALNEELPEQNEADPSHPKKGLMVRTERDDYPFATSMYWDGGAPEVERPFENAFPMMILGIKLRGTTIADISAHWIRTNFLILGALSLLMGAGMVLTYRNVARELALAKLKSDFVSNVSHELRTPLALIRLYAETLELGRISGTGKQQEYYEIIRKESERLTSLINNILDFSRIESGKKEYTFRETNVADLVRSTLESYRFEIEQNGFKFEQKIEDVPPLWVDREAIARSLLNLVNNAVKYSANEKYLLVHLYRHENGVNLEVVDHGIGIPAKDHLKIFEKFYRVGDPLVHNTKGSGLGLSLVGHIVKAHGGEVAVESVPGKGSKFIITLPLQRMVGQE